MREMVVKIEGLPVELLEPTGRKASNTEPVTVVQHRVTGWLQLSILGKVLQALAEEGMRRDLDAGLSMPKDQPEPTCGETGDPCWHQADTAIVAGRRDS